MVNLKRAKNPDKTTFEVRSGAMRLLGMRPDVHPAALSPNEFVRLINTRRVGPDIVGRPGQTLLVDVNDGGAERSISGMADLQLGTLRPMLVIGDGCPGVHPSAGQSMSSFTLEQSPNFKRAVYEPAATSMFPVRFKRGASTDGLVPPVDGMFFTVDNKLYRRQTIPVGYNTDPLVTTGGSGKVLVWTAPAAYSRISAVCQHGSVLLIAVQGPGSGAGTSAIIRWDGLTFSVDDSGLDPVTGFATFRSLAIAGFAGSPNSIRVRDAAGAWSTVLPSAGTVSLAGSNRAASYSDELYLPSGEDLFSFDGTNLTRIPVGTTGVDAGATIYGLARAFGYLFAAWSSPTKTRILRFDNSTWVPNHKDLRLQEATVRDARSIQLYQGCLMVATTTLASGALLFRSPRRSTTGTYTQIVPAASLNGDITEMAAF